MDEGVFRPPTNESDDEEEKGEFYWYDNFVKSSAKRKRKIDNEDDDDNEEEDIRYVDPEILSRMSVKKVTFSSATKEEEEDTKEKIPRPKDVNQVKKMIIPLLNDDNENITRALNRVDKIIQQHKTVKKNSKDSSSSSSSSLSSGDAEIVKEARETFDRLTELATHGIDLGFTSESNPFFFSFSRSDLILWPKEEGSKADHKPSKRCLQRDET